MNLGCFFRNFSEKIFTHFFRTVSSFLENFVKSAGRLFYMSNCYYLRIEKKIRLNNFFKL